MKIEIVICFLVLCAVFLPVCGGTETKPDGITSQSAASASSATAVTPKTDKAIVSLAGRWKNENKNERGVWLFDTSGRCIIRSSGIVEQKGRYAYDGKALILNLDSGTTSYRVLENREPRLVITMRWGDLYNLTNVLVRVP